MPSVSLTTIPFMVNDAYLSKQALAVHTLANYVCPCEAASGACFYINVFCESRNNTVYGDTYS